MSEKKFRLHRGSFDEWGDPEKWPHDRPDYVFLARAFERVGQMMFGDQWNTLDIKIEEPTEPDDDADEATWERYERDSDLYDDAYEEADEKRELTHDGVARKVAEQSELKNLKTAYLQKNGTMTPIEPYRWNADYLEDLFAECKISIQGEKCWIFVDGESLDQILKTQSHVPSISPGIPHCSPYLRVMLLVCEKMGITPDHQPKKSEIEAEIKAAWKANQSWRGTIELSEHLAEAMATLIREPESQRGRAKKD
jgi:hypothetical protein